MECLYLLSADKLMVGVGGEGEWVYLNSSGVYVSSVANFMVHIENILDLTKSAKNGLGFLLEGNTRIQTKILSLHKCLIIVGFSCK